MISYDVFVVGNNSFNNTIDHDLKVTFEQWHLSELSTQDAIINCVGGELLL